MKPGYYPDPPAPPREPVTHDLVGVDHSCQLVKPDGAVVSIACWTGPKPRPGDFLILPNVGRTTRYRVTEMNYCMNVDPPTMWMATAEFAPREDRQ